MGQYGWHKYTVCVKCGYRATYGVSDIWNAFGDPCPDCGHSKWTEIVSKWHSDAVWYKPWTWWSGHWEDFD